MPLLLLNSIESIIGCFLKVTSSTPNSLLSAKFSFHFLLDRAVYSSSIYHVESDSPLLSTLSIIFSTNLEYVMYEIPTERQFVCMERFCAGVTPNKMFFLPFVSIRNHLSWNPQVLKLWLRVCSDNKTIHGLARCGLLISWMAMLSKLIIQRMNESSKPQFESRDLSSLQAVHFIGIGQGDENYL